MPPLLYTVQVLYIAKLLKVIRAVDELQVSSYILISNINYLTGFIYIKRKLSNSAEALFPRICFF